MPITAQGGAGPGDADPRHKDIDAISFPATRWRQRRQECHRRHWAVPGRIAIAGYGDMDLAAQLFPPLTTVKVSRYDGPARGAAIARRLGGDTKVPTITSLGFEIVDREAPDYDLDRSRRPKGAFSLGMDVQMSVGIVRMILDRIDVEIDAEPRKSGNDK